jgi:arsenate reductase-like glutaredoxin family protein
VLFLPFEVAEFDASLMMEKPSVIKRPIVERNGTVLSVGFETAEWAQTIKG